MKNWNVSRATKLKYVVIGAIAGSLLTLMGLAFVGCESYNPADVRFNQGTATQMQGVVEKIDEEYNRTMPDVKAVVDEVASEQYSENEDEGLNNLIQAIRAGNRASAPWNPYAPVIEVVMLAASSFAALFFRKKASVAETKYTAHKVGVEKFRNQLEAVPPTETTSLAAVRSDLYKAIGDERTARGI